MERLTGRYPNSFTPTSQSGGNTIADPLGHKLAQTAPGSESVNPLPDRSDNQVDTDSGAVTDHAHIVGQDGGKGSRPADSGPFKRAGDDRGGWSRV